MAIAWRPARRSASSGSRQDPSLPSASRLRSGASGASGNTGIATTAIGDEPDRDYIGRFAPSPTGDLHLGSLVAAVGSYLDARHRGGRWLVRMEDLDSSRVIPGCADRILRTLERFGLHWDGEVLWQSRRGELYAAAIESLRRRGLTFECTCSRRELAEIGDQGYPGTCRSGPAGSGPSATRFRIDDAESVTFEDRVQGLCRISLRALGDFIIRRKDGIPSYQLAVVVDDAEQKITHIVRGADLLESTGWQILLQRRLGVREPGHAHLPLVVESADRKLSKSRFALPVEAQKASAHLSVALELLGHPPHTALRRESPAVLLDWAARSWNLDAVQGQRTVLVPARFAPPVPGV